MKDAILTVRLPRATRTRIEKLARRDGRSLSQQVERLLEAGLGNGPQPPSGSLADVLRSARVPDLRDFRRARHDLSRMLDRRSRPRA